jgi:hypothetical protein
MAARTIAHRLLDVIDRDIVALAERGVAAGNTVFGAALLNLSLVIAGTTTQDIVFSTTHEPCTPGSPAKEPGGPCAVS